MRQRLFWEVTPSASKHATGHAVVPYPLHHPFTQCVIQISALQRRAGLTLMIARTVGRINQQRRTHQSLLGVEQRIGARERIDVHVVARVQSQTTGSELAQGCAIGVMLYGIFGVWLLTEQTPASDLETSFRAPSIPNSPEFSPIFQPRNPRLIVFSPTQPRPSFLRPRFSPAGGAESARVRADSVHPPCL